MLAGSSHCQVTLEVYPIVWKWTVKSVVKHKKQIKKQIKATLPVATWKESTFLQSSMWHAKIYLQTHFLKSNSEVDFFQVIFSSLTKHYLAMEPSLPFLRK